MRKRTNKVRSENGYYVVDIGTDKFPDLKMLIDKDDYERIRMLSKSRMTPKKGAKENDPIYARMRFNGKLVLVHRLVLGIKIKHFDVDHINHNTLDNRRCNLRMCTRSENVHNYSIVEKRNGLFRGVNRIGNRRFQVSIKVQGRKFDLGVFPTKQAARTARIKAEAIYCGEFMPEANKFIARQNGFL